MRDINYMPAVKFLTRLDLEHVSELARLRRISRFWMGTFKMQGQKLYGHIDLRKGERSELADLASDLL